MVPPLQPRHRFLCLQMSKDYKAALVGLHVQDIEELRSYRQPPALVVRVTDTLCMLFGKEPGWENAKLLLNQEDFYQVGPAGKGQGQQLLPQASHAPSTTLVAWAFCSRG